MNQRVEAAIVSPNGGGEIGERLVRSDIAGIAMRSSKFGGKLFHLVANALALIDEAQSGTLRVEGPRDAGGDRPTISNAGDQCNLTV